MTRPSLPMRALATALCLTLTLPAQAARFGDLWPDPQPQPQRPVAPTKPNFRAPSSMSCERPVEARVVGGRPVQQQAHGDARDREADKREMATRSKIKGEVDIAGARDKAAPFIPMPEVAMAAPMPMPATAPIQRAPSVPQVAAPVTAGMVDDNADFNEYLAFRARTQVQHRERDVRERYLLDVKDASGHGVPDAEVAVRSANGAAMWARTDTAGRAWLHPNAFDPGNASNYEVTARKNGRNATATLTRGQKSAVELRLDGESSSGPARLDLVFLVDATGSMGDEIEKLRGSLQHIVAEISSLPSRPDLCLGLVAYRDKVDEFLIKSHDLSNDVQGFQGALNRLQADGGGDYPEAMNEAFDDTVQNISWRGNGATRLVVLLADAPPHLDYGGPQYDNTMMAALGKGIKVFSVGASGLDKQGEYIQRQIAQYTGGRFVFLTYENAARPGAAPGRETSHDVHNYSVDTLDRLIVRLVSQELAALN